MSFKIQRGFFSENYGILYSENKHEIKYTLRENDEVKEGLKFGVISLKTVCDVTEQLLNENNNWGVNFGGVAAQIERYIDCKKEYYKNRLFGEVLYRASKKTGSISQALKLIRKIHEEHPPKFVELLSGQGEEGARWKQYDTGVYWFDSDSGTSSNKN